MKYKKNVYQSLMLVTQFSINMLVPIFGCSFLGISIDRRLGTSFLMIFFFFIGSLAGFRNIFRMAKRIYTRDEGRDENGRKESKR